MKALDAKVADPDAECQYASFWIAPGDVWSGPVPTCSGYVHKKNRVREGGEKLQK